MRTFLAGLVCVLVLLVGGFWFTIGKNLVVHAPFYPVPQKAMWLPADWAAKHGAWFQHADQGTMTFNIPYEWFAALRQPVLFGGDGSGDMADTAYLDRFGFIPGDSGLPVGIAVGTAAVTPDGTPWLNPRSQKPWTGIGLTCAACHTGRLTYKGTELRIYGGAALTNLGTFRTALGIALLYTDLLPWRFDAFADRVLGDGATAAQKQALKAQMDAVLGAGKEEKKKDDELAPLTVAEGFGRLDALNRIGNQVFAVDTGNWDNYAATNAPVHYPHIWDASWFTWVQYDGSIEQPMVRNAGEAMGVSARVWTSGGVLHSTVRVDELYKIESALAGDTPPDAAHGFTGLRAPAWPEAVLGKIDAGRAAKGAALYKEVCEGCHLPPNGSAAFWASPRWTQPNAAGERYLDLKMIPTATLGTDDAQAKVLVNRKVMLANGPVPFATALGDMVAKTVTAWYDAQIPPTAPADRERINGNRPNSMQAVMAYKAPPLDGIWAAPPYLHNGSVPTVYDLLSPVSERPRPVVLGNREYDPVKMGYVNGAMENGFAMLMERPGDSNRGHEFSNTPGPGVIGRALSPDERYALIEYLKTL